MEATIPQEYGRARLAVFLMALLLLQACAGHRPVQPPHSAPAGAPYAGMSVTRSDEGGVLVLDVIAGPAALAGIVPGDRIVSIAGEQVDAPRFGEVLASSRPGDVLALALVRGGASIQTELVVGNLESWTPPLRRPSRNPSQAPLERPRVWLDDVEARAGAVARELDPVKDRIDRMLREVAGDPAGYNRLPLSRAVLADPGMLIAVEEQLSVELASPAEIPVRVTSILCRLLAVECRGGSADAAEAPLALEAFAAAIAQANVVVRRALPDADRGRMLDDAKNLLRQVAARRTLLDRPNALAGIRAMRYSEHVDVAALAGAFESVIANALRAPRDAAPGKAIPRELAAMVEGEILAFVEIDGGFVVVGGTGPNRYRMDRLYAVIDIGGSDRYAWGDARPLETQTVVDFEGDDRYEATTGGPGAGWLGVAVLLDLEGADAYVTTLGGCGAGVHGFGLLFDAGGSDSYRCDAWSAGAGIYGGGVLVDGGDGADSYVSQVLAQGVGGPGGVGLLVDGGGNDLYRANGPVPSAYGTPASYMAFSQGVGFGIRAYEQGGFGALLDHGGNDRYEGGEFSQGGGYQYGVGLLRDASGNDLYYGNRYAQGFGCHQAAGLLADHAGDDMYWAMTAVAQGAAWDQSVGLLFEGGGNDIYRADTLAQGAAAQQSRAWLFDAGGDDDYRSSAGSAQGAAAENAYHYQPDDPAFSVGILVDGRGEDRYSSGLANGTSRTRFDPSAAKGAGNAGLAIDE